MAQLRGFTLGCNHRQQRVAYRFDRDGCVCAICMGCGKRGPKKHSRPLALARFRSVGPLFRGAGSKVRYTGTAAHDDLRLARKKKPKRVYDMMRGWIVNTETR